MVTCVPKVEMAARVQKMDVVTSAPVVEVVSNVPQYTIILLVRACSEGINDDNEQM